jgi:hypothetical protein
MMAPFVPFVPAGALIFGVRLENGIGWPIVAVGYAICSFGLTPISSIALTYITDSYTEVRIPLAPIRPFSSFLQNLSLPYYC